MIHIAIVEDEDIWAETIIQYLNRYGTEEQEEFHTQRFHDGYEIVEKYPDELDIIFMDIEMGMMNGIEAAEEIRKKDDRVAIIFITCMAQYAIKGYKVNALDYILKPISYVPFSQSLKKAVYSLNLREDTYITVKFRDGITKLCSKDILWIESHGHRLTFHSETGDYETTVYSMKEMETQLEPKGFKRCNSGVLVNLRRVCSVRNGYVEIGQSRLLISRGKKTDFMDELVRIMTE